MDPGKLAELQLQMRQNQEDLSSYLKDLDSWEKDIKETDKNLKSGASDDKKESVEVCITSDNSVSVYLLLWQDVWRC